MCIILYSEYMYLRYTCVYIYINHLVGGFKHCPVSTIEVIPRGVGFPATRRDPFPPKKRKGKPRSHSNM